MQTLVTGATGFVGSRLVDLLLEEGHQVRALLRERQREGADPAKALAERGVEIVMGELGDARLVADATRDVDVVFHLAWQANRISDGNPSAGSAQEQYRSNMNGAQNIIDACQDHGVKRLVFTSTISVYGADGVDPDRPKSEEDRVVDPRSSSGRYLQGYVQPKIAVEQLIRERLPEPDYVILRPSMVYGPNAQFASQLLRRAFFRGSRGSNRVHTVQWVHVDDLARALQEAAQEAQAANETVNIAGTEAVLNNDLMDEIQAMTRRLLGRGGAGGWENRLRSVGLKYDVAKARDLLGFESSIPLETGLEQMVAAELRKGRARAPAGARSSSRERTPGRPWGAGRFDGAAAVNLDAEPDDRRSRARLHNERMVQYYHHHQAREGQGEADYYGGSDYWNFGLWTDDVRTQAEASEHLVDELLSFIPSKTGRILDVACGKGATTRRLLEDYESGSVTAINISREQLEVCRKNLPDIDFRQMDAAAMEFEDESFDNIICVEAASHFLTREGYLKEAYRLLKPGGRLVFSDCLMSRESPTQPEENYLPGPDEYAALCEQVGFDKVKVYGVKPECWQGFASNMREYIIGRFRAGEISWRDRILAMGWLQRVEPEDYVIGWCEKAS